MAMDNRAESEACLGHQMALSVQAATSDIPSGMDEEIACMMSVRMETSRLSSDGRKRYVGGFDYPPFVESSVTYKTLLCKLCDTYPWGCRDSVELKYYEREQNIWVDVACDDDAALMFGKV